MNIKTEEEIKDEESALDPINANHTFSKKLLHFIKNIFIAIFVVIVVWAFIWELNPDNNIIGIDEMRESYKIAKEIIKDEDWMTSSPLKFPRFEPEFVTQRSKKIIYDGEEYAVRTVTSYVDCDNIFGVEVRNNYQINVGLPTNNNNPNIYYDIVSIGNDF